MLQIHDVFESTTSPSTSHSAQVALLLQIVNTFTFCADDGSRTHKFQILSLLPLDHSATSAFCLESPDDLVRMTGLEPARLSTIVSKTITVTNYVTSPNETKHV